MATYGDEPLTHGAAGTPDRSPDASEAPTTEPVATPEPPTAAPQFVETPAPAPAPVAPPPPPPPPQQPPYYYPPAPGPAPRRGMSGCTIIVLVGLGLLVLVGLMAMFTSMLPSSGGRHRAAFGGMGSGEVAVIELSGMIQEESSAVGLFSSGGAGARSLCEQVREAAKDDSIKAVVLRINSPGGSAAASQAIYSEVMKLREKKPVIAQMADVAASGGYYVASACTSIIAAPATMTGSIGVIMAATNYSGLAQKFGVTDNTITSGKYKDTGSMLRPMRPDERALMQDMVNEVYGQFVADVAKGRKMPLEKIKKLADGRVYAGSQAKRVGLVDDLGSYHDALTLAANKAGIKGEPSVREMGSTGGLYQWLRETSEAGGALARQRSALPFAGPGPGIWMVLPGEGTLEAR